MIAGLRQIQNAAANQVQPGIGYIKIRSASSFGFGALPWIVNGVIIMGMTMILVGSLRQTKFKVIAGLRQIQMPRKSPFICRYWLHQNP